MVGEGIEKKEDASGGRGGSFPPDPLGGGVSKRVEAWSEGGASGSVVSEMGRSAAF